MRRFIAIPLPGEVRQNIADLLTSFRDIEGLKPVKKSNLHLTLAFLGDSGSESQIGELREISFRPFTLSTTEASMFPERRPRLAGCLAGVSVLINIDKAPYLPDLPNRQIIRLIKGIQGIKPQHSLRPDKVIGYLEHHPVIQGEYYIRPAAHNPVPVGHKLPVTHEPSGSGSIESPLTWKVRYLRFPKGKEA
jgi:hypothetical protein